MSTRGIDGDGGGVFSKISSCDELEYLSVVKVGCEV